MLPKRYSKFFKPCSEANFDPNSTMAAELSTAMTFFAVRAKSCESVPSPAPRSAMVMGGSKRRSPWAKARHERPGT
jgi:hypothetical protein